MNRPRIPCSSLLLTEARLYALESKNFTMDYRGWQDQHNKLERLTYGKFAQLWVYEYCRLNGIPCEKDTSSHRDPDDKDLTISGHDIDVKASIIPSLVGQISPGVYKREGGFYCFMITDRDCSFIRPIGFLSKAKFMEHSSEVKKGEVIPGTNIKQRFGSSRFVSPGAPVIDFFKFMDDARLMQLDRYLSEAA